MATPSAVPTAPAPTMPITGWSSGPEWRAGAGGRRVDLVTVTMECPAGAGSRSMPCLAPARRRLVVGRARAAALEGAPGPHRRARVRRSSRGTLARNECTEPSEDGPVATHRPLRRPRAARARPPRPLPARRARRPDRPRPGAGHGQDPARERAAPRRRRRSSGPRTSRRLAVLAAGRRGRGRDPVHAVAGRAPGLHRRPRRRRPRGDARRDGRPRRRPGPGQPAGARGPRHRPLGPGRPRSGRRGRSPSTSSASTSATSSATSCCAGRRRPSATCASCRPAPASSTRSTSSSWPRSWPTGPTTAAGRLPRHPRRDRFAHDDDQRPRACSATASAASRPRPSCSGSRSTSRCPRSSACG